MTDSAQPMFSEEPEKEATPSDSSPENEEKDTASPDASVEEVPKDLNEEDKPLHKDSRFQRVIEERNRLRAEKESLLEAQRVREETPRETSNTNGSKPAWFTKYFGEDDEAWKGFQDLTAQAKEQAKQEAIEEIGKRESQEKQALAEASDWVDEQIEGLTELGEKFDRNALLKVMDEYRPTDDAGNLDFKKGLAIYKAVNPEKSMASRKKLADTLTSKGGKMEPSSKDYVTSADLKKWRQRGEL